MDVWGGDDIQLGNDSLSLSLLISYLYLCVLAPCLQIDFYLFYGMPGFHKRVTHFWHCIKFEYFGISIKV